MELRAIEGEFSVCKVEDYSQVNFGAQYYFIDRTDDENSLVCLTRDVPQNATHRDDGWRAMRVQGALDFSLVGILAKLSGTLAESGVGIFAVSTYDTDYILAKRENFPRALDALRRAGHRVLE